VRRRGAARGHPRIALRRRSRATQVGAAAVRVAGPVPGPGVRGTGPGGAVQPDDRADRPQGEDPRHDEHHGTGHRESRTEPGHGRADRPVRPLALGQGGDAEQGLQRPAIRFLGRGRVGGKVCYVGPRPDLAEEGLASDNDEPAEHHQLTAQQPPLPLEPRLAEPCTDLRQAVADRLQLIRCRVQHAAEDRLVVAFLSRHAPRSRPLTAPLSLLTSPSPTRPAVPLRPGRCGF